MSLNLNKPKIKCRRNHIVAKIKNSKSHALVSQRPMVSEIRKMVDTADAGDLAYLSDRDKEFWKALGEALRLMATDADQTGSLLAFILTRHSDTRWAVEERSTPFDVPLILKSKAAASKGAINSISRIVPVTRHASEDS